jgi:predicted PurR-regulated permease PerM
MTSDKTIKLVSVAIGIVVMLAMSVLFGIPGLLLGAILGAIAALIANERLQRMKPENRRRERRMLRNEGLS